MSDLFADQTEVGAGGETPPPKKDEPRKERSGLGFVRGMAVAIGFLVVLFGAILGGWMFITLVRHVMEPQKAMPIVDGWEQVVRGLGDGVDIMPTAVVYDGSSPKVATLRLEYGDRPTTTTATGERVYTDVGNRVYTARFLALLLIILAVGILMRFPIVLIRAGGSIMSRATSGVIEKKR